MKTLIVMFLKKNIFLIIIFLQSLLSICQNEEIVFPIKHSFSITSLKYFNDKKYIVTTSSDCTIKLWLANQNVLLKTFTGHTDVVNCADFSEKNNLIISGSNDSLIIIWNVLTSDIKFKISLNEKVTTLAIIKNNKLVAGTSNGKIILINIISGEIENTFTIQDSKITCISLLKDENKFIAATSKQNENDDAIGDVERKGSLYLFDLENFNKPIAISNYKEDVNYICLSADSEKFASSAKNGMVRVWNTKEYIEEISFKNYNLIPEFLFFSPNNKMVAVASQKTNKINIWRITGEKLFDFNIKSGKIIYGEFDKESLEMSICNNLGSYEVYDLDARRGENLGEFLQNESYVTSIAISKTSNFLAFGFGNGIIRGFNLNTSLPVKYTMPQSTKVLSLSFSNDEKKLYVSNDQLIISFENSNKLDVGSSFLSFLENATGNIKNIITYNSEYTTSLANIPDYCISGLNSGVLKFYQNENSKEISQYRLHDYDIININVSADNKQLVTCSADATAKAWKIDGTKLTQSNIYQYNNEVINAYYIAINKLFIANIKGEGIKINDKNKISVNINNDFSDIAINEKDSVLYAALNNSTSCLSYSFNGNKIWEFKEISLKILFISFSSKYNMLFCVLENGNIVLLDAKNGKKIATLIIFDNNNWLIYTPDNFFDASKTVINNTNIVSNLNILPHENIEKFYQNGILAKLLKL